MNLSRSWLVWNSVRLLGEPQGLLLEDGDWVSSDSLLFRYVSGDGTALSVTFDEWSTRLSGEIVTLMLGSEGALRWLQSASRRELAAVRLVNLGSDSLDQASLAALKRLATVNPHVGLVVDSDDVLLQVLPFFRPRELIGAVTLRNLQNLRQLETLFITASDSGSLGFLADLSHVRRLILSDWDMDKAGLLPAGMTRLRSLTAHGGDAPKDALVLGALPAELEELSFIGIDGSLDLSGLPQLPALRTLILAGSEVANDLSNLEGLEKLEWLSLPQNITQRQFAALLARHPDLRILEVTGADSVTDLAPLRGLKKLEGLVLTSPDVTLEVLSGLKSLRFVGLYADSSRASRDRLASVRRALPEALVVPVEPVSLCLGSGWILFLVPVTVALWFIWRRTLRPKAAVVRGT
jgi:hypothetical protein